MNGERFTASHDIKKGETVVVDGGWVTPDLKEYFIQKYAIPGTWPEVYLRFAGGEMDREKYLLVREVRDE